MWSPVAHPLSLRPSQPGLSAPAVGARAFMILGNTCVSSSVQSCGRRSTQMRSWRSPLRYLNSTGPDSTSVYRLDPIVVEGRIDNLTGSVSTASVGRVGYRDLRLRPLLREGELLETVPGLIMTQHSGDGKSNQIFVRGFNLDHGTDFATSIEGMPVNIPTHAHGQGYTDLNFMIPELVDHIEYSLGNYYADVGDFGSAGAARFRLRRNLEQPLWLAEVGEHGFRRTVAGGATDIGGGRLLVGGELKAFDGAWEVPQRLRKYSGVARYSWQGPRDLFSILAMGYDNSWASSDQIPTRAVEGGLLTPLGQIDRTLGGASSRYSLSTEWTRTGTVSGHKLQLFGIHYGLDLFSNFTYFLGDPANGDQIRQRDRGRRIAGLNYAHVREVDWGTARIGLPPACRCATTTRTSPSNSRARGRRSTWSGATMSACSPEGSTRSSIRRGPNRFAPWSVFVSITSASMWRIAMGSRPARSRGRSSARNSPLRGTPRPDTEVYLSGGTGFHSNDARGTVLPADPAAGSGPVDPLVRSRGAELGLRVAPGNGWQSTFTLWSIELDSELLFVGDEGTTEASDTSRRIGVTVANFWRVSERLVADLDFSLARARFVGVPSNEDRIPGALENIVTAGVRWEPRLQANGPFAVLRFRRLSSYPLIETNAVRAQPSPLTNLQVGYRIGRARISATLLNLLDSTQSDIQYYYESRLSSEPLAVEDVHFHPLEPRQLRITVGWGR